MAYVARALCILLIVVVTVLIWKTAEYFNGLTERDKNRPLIAWDTVMLFFMLIYLVVRLITV